MKMAVLGAGLMGRAIVYDLSRASGVEEVWVADADPKLAAEVASRYGNGITGSFSFDVNNGDKLAKFLSGSAAAVGAVSYRYNALITRACITAGVHYCDLGGNNSVVREQFQLSDDAAGSNVAVVPDCGLAPGMVSILAMRTLALNPTADTVRLRVGGLPADPVPPFNYQIVFSVEGLINEYKEPTFALRDGEIVQVPTLGDLEEITFPELFGELEAFNTSGGASTLPWTLKNRVRNVDYKTIRYPGHRDLIAALFELGLADEEGLFLNGAHVIPRKVLENRLTAKLDGSAPDVVLALVESSGPDGTASFRLIDRFDEETGLSAMMRCTAFPAAIIAHMLATNEITERGTLNQEKVIPTAPFVGELRKRGIKLDASAPA